MASFFHLLSIFYLSFLLLIIYQASAAGAVDPTKGFVSLPLNRSHYRIQKPYNVPEDQRYSFIDGVHKCWVFSTDKPHTIASKTKPRTEIFIKGYNYSSGVWQFEGYGYVPSGTTGVSIMQILGAKPGSATTLMIRVYNGSLTYYREVLVSDIYDKWFRLNVVHDVDAGKMSVYIDGDLKLERDDRGGTTHYFKCGVYTQNDNSNCMESRWKNIKVLKKM